MTDCRVLLLLACGQIALPLHSAWAQRSAPRPPLDVVLVGGRVLDPETNLDAVRAVGIRDGRIVSITTAVPAARVTVDVRGAMGNVRPFKPGALTRRGSRHTIEPPPSPGDFTAAFYLTRRTFRGDWQSP